MLVFIDESGDNGLHLVTGSSKNLIVTLVLFEDHAEALRADERIANLRRELGLNAGFEFHFSKLKQEWRERFLRVVGVFDFLYFSIVIDKAEIVRRGSFKPAELYRYACHLAIELAKPYLKEAIVVVDGSGSHQFRMDLATELRKRTNRPGETGGHLRKIKFQDSHRNNLLQLADMVCGAVARSVSDKPDATIYRKLISHCEMTVLRWPI